MSARAPTAGPLDRPTWVDAVQRIEDVPAGASLVGAVLAAFCLVVFADTAPPIGLRVAEAVLGLAIVAFVARQRERPVRLDGARFGVVALAVALPVVLRAGTQDAPAIVERTVLVTVVLVALATLLPLQRARAEAPWWVAPAVLVVAQTADAAVTAYALLDPWSQHGDLVETGIVAAAIVSVHPLILVPVKLALGLFGAWLLERPLGPLMRPGSVYRAAAYVFLVARGLHPAFENVSLLLRTTAVV